MEENNSLWSKAIKISIEQETKNVENHLLLYLHTQRRASELVLKKAIDHNNVLNIAQIYYVDVGDKKSIIFAIIAAWSELSQLKESICQAQNQRVSLL